MGWFGSQLLFGELFGWLATTVIGVLDLLWGLLSATAFSTPDVTVLPQVTAFANTSLAIVNVCFVLAFLWAGIVVMGRGTFQSQVGPGELIPRLVLGLILANFAVPLCSTVIGLANALTAALTSQDITAPGSMRQLREITVSAMKGQTGATATSLLLILVGGLIAALTGTLIVQWIIRLGVLVIAVGIAPIALALHGTPHTEGAAKLWWRTLLGTVGIVVVQAVALHATLLVFLSPNSNLPLLGVSVADGDPAGILNLLIVVCLLWAVVKIPALMRRFVTQARPSRAGTVLRVVAVQQLTRGLSRGLAIGHGASRLARGTGPSTGSATGPASYASASRPAGSGRRSLRPAGAGPGRVGIAYPTGRIIRPYTPDELAEGVDLYTRALKTRTVSASVPPQPSSAPRSVVTPRAMPQRSAAPHRIGNANRIGRVARPYTADEIAGGVDLYTRALKARASEPGKAPK
ncbi:hypothetical protein HH310_42300 [Actinoplanes sp. TBRC 11911]|uniref:hypothetical protein n=1 Tax=Actinoplanes sp. TBRC 11911 TaxID=2729386 RepID=UPI00145D7FD2|nr:hypothetical protein [Actinoplanes sp. TBRC 11911]NMO57782.1 hypothetical protein [Actinoplanes sp. TBRC 11911]